MSMTFSVNFREIGPCGTASAELHPGNIRPQDSVDKLKSATQLNELKHRRPMRVKWIKIFTFWEPFLV
jgi:hypothetical protein